MPKFADDVELYRAIDNAIAHSELSSALNNLISWSENWQLPIAVSKCSAFHIGTKNPQLNYTIMGELLPHVSEVKNLGIWFSSSLKCASRK